MLKKRVFKKAILKSAKEAIFVKKNNVAKKIINKSIPQKVFFLNKKKYLQQFNFSSNKEKLNISLKKANGENIGEIRIKLIEVANTKQAFIEWSQIENQHKVPGLYFKMLNNTLGLLKNKGIKLVVANSVLAGHKTYHKLGFNFLRRFGETEIWKEL